MKQKTNSLFSIAAKIRPKMQFLFLAWLMLAITTGVSQKAAAQNCVNATQYPASAFASPISGVGPYTITTAQYQSEYNQMTGALAGNTFQSTASIAGTWITVRAETATGAIVANGSTPHNWTASAGGTYFIHYNTNSVCGTANTNMTSTVENTTPNCANTIQFPALAFASPIKGAGPYTITTAQYQEEYNQMTGALIGSTFRSTAGNAGTWITVRAGSVAGAIVTQGSTPLNWTASAGGTYFIHYNTNSACGTATTNMTTTVENTTPSCANTVQFPNLAFASPIKGAGPYTITTGQFQQEYNQMTGALAGSTFQSTASIAGTWITVRAGTVTGNVAAQGSTPLNWTASAGGTYFIHYNTNTVCGTANTGMTSQVANTTPVCANTIQFPTSAFASPIKGAGPYTISTAQTQSQYNQMTGALAGSTFQSTASIAGTWITVRSGTATGALVAQGSTPLNWTASAGGTYFIHYNTNSVCGTANTNMTSTVENTSSPDNDACAGASNIASLPYTSPVVFNTGATDDYTASTCDGPYKNLWWKVTGICGTLTASTCGSSFDTKLAVFTGSCGTFTEVACNDDFGPSCATSSASVSWATTPGTVYYISAGSFSNISPTGSMQLSVSASPTAIPAIPALISGVASVCANSQQTYSIAAVTNASNYTWTAPANSSIVSGQGSLSVVVQYTSAFVSGNLSVVSSNCSGTSVSQTLAVTKIATSATPGTITGVASVCGGAQQTYSIAAVTNASNYTWTAPANASIVSGQGGLSVVVQYTSAFVSGNLSVVSSNCSGTSAAKTLAVTKIATSATPGTITGVASVCAGAQQTYSIAAVTNASNYTWTAPANASIVSGQGGLSVVVQYTSAFVSGNLSVVSSNCSGTSAAKTLAITKAAVPGTVGTISGVTAGACSAETRGYTVAALPNTTSYIWTVPANATILSGQGSTLVIVQFATGFTTGTLSVKGENCSGTSVTARTLALSNVTATPTVLTGPATAVCAGSTHTFSTTEVSGQTTNVWTVPAGAVINGYNSGISISVTFPSPFTTGAVTVKSATSCYTSAAKSLTVYSTPVTPTSITGPLTAVCSGSTQTYSCTASTTGATGYNWTVPTGATILTGATTSSITVQFPTSFVSGAVTVKAFNACGESVAKSATVSSTIAQPGVIAGTSTNLCGGGSYTYTIAAVTGATGYIWSVPPGWTITANTGISVTVSIPTTTFTTATLSVTAQSACGNSSARTLTLSALPATPTAITGSTSVCASATGLVYSTPVVAGVTSYTWTVPTGAIITSGQNTSSITVTWGTVAGSVTVKAGNTCGINATAKTLAVTLAVCRMGEELAEETSIEVDATSNDLRVYPNPTAGNANVVFGSEVGGKYTINVLNALGQVVYSKTASSTTGENTHAIDISELSSGLYFINLMEDSGMRSLRLVKR